MRKWHISKPARCILMMLFLAGVALGARKVLWPDELVYRGKSVTEWMELTFWGDRPGTSMSTGEWMEAADAVDKMGAKIIPAALKLAWTRDSDLKRTVMKSPWPRKGLTSLVG